MRLTPLGAGTVHVVACVPDLRHGTEKLLHAYVGGPIFDRDPQALKECTPDLRHKPRATIGCGSGTHSGKGPLLLVGWREETQTELANIPLKTCLQRS